MFQRLAFLVIAVFFIVMNILLWRSEISGKSSVGGPVPVEHIFRKLVTAPDDSALEIRHHGKKIGYCRWTPNVGEELQTGKRAEEMPPEGMVGQVSGYTLDLDGSFDSEELRRVRFNVSLKLDTNRVWQTLSVRVMLNPNSYEVAVNAAEEQIILSFNEDGRTSQQTLTFAQARHPEQLLTALAGPMAGRFWKTLGVPIPLTSDKRSGLDPGLKWEARQDWLQIGRSRIRVYRLQARIFNSYQIVLLIGRAGEILRVDLPDRFSLVNDAVFNL